MQLISKYDIIMDNNARVVPLKKGITITNVFQKSLDESGCKPNKVLVDKGKEFYKWSKKSWLQDNNA